MKQNTDSVACWSLATKPEEEKSTSLSRLILYKCTTLSLPTWLCYTKQLNGSTEVTTSPLLQDTYLVSTQQKSCLT